MVLIYFIAAVSLAILIHKIYMSDYEEVAASHFNIMRLLAAPAFILLNHYMMCHGYVYIAPIFKMSSITIADFCIVIGWFLCIIMGLVSFTGILFHISDSINIYKNHSSFMEVVNKYTDAYPEEHQRMNIKLFNKCFNVNPNYFAFYGKKVRWEDRHTKLDYIIYDKTWDNSKEHYDLLRYGGGSGKVGIICGFWCYWWMHDVILWWNQQEQNKIKAKEKEARERRLMATPISDHVVNTLEKELEEVNKMIKTEIIK